MGAAVGRPGVAGKSSRGHTWQVRIDLGSDGDIGNLGFGRQPSVIDLDLPNPGIVHSAEVSKVRWQCMVLRCTTSTACWYVYGTWCLIPVYQHSLTVQIWYF